jgi:hypothetical protein
MSIAVMKQALEALEQIKGFMFHPAKVFSWEPSIIALRAAIEQAEKPVAWQGVHDHTDLYYRKPPQADVRPLYTTPPAAPRQWVGLTDEEVNEFYWISASTLEAIEEKLKEKNT